MMKINLFQPNRRQFIKACTATGLSALLMPRMSLSASLETGTKRLVLIEMNGGIDGLNTVIPYGNGTYYDLRPRLAIPDSQVLHLNQAIGLHPVLKQLHTRYIAGEVAIIQGVGHPSHDLSHFTMMDTWRAGHPNGSGTTGHTGWLGRLLDVISPHDVLAGISIANGVGPALASQKAIVSTLYSPYQPYIPPLYHDTVWKYINDVATFNADDHTMLASTRKGMRDSNLSLQLIPSLQTGKVSYQANETSRLFDLTARILGASQDARVLHIPLPLDFDTHRNQASKLAANLMVFDDALDRFLHDIQQRNLADQVIIMVVSEFGRRAMENDSEGTDHGTANNVLIIGNAVKGGLYGQQPSLTSLDDDGNLQMSLSYLDVFASITQGWFGVSASQILPSGEAFDLFA